VAAAFAIFLVACTEGGQATDSGDPYAGHESQIQAWRDAVEANHPACSAKVEGKGCQDFQVMCKAAQDITPEEAAEGVTAKLVAAMTFAGRNPDGSTGKSGSSFNYIVKSADGWSRQEAKPVNMSSCAPL
jgi:phosphopantothenoylcysteine synthetase/decarboxylase